MLDTRIYRNNELKIFTSTTKNRTFLFNKNMYIIYIKTEKRNGIAITDDAPRETDSEISVKTKNTNDIYKLNKREHDVEETSAALFLNLPRSNKDSAISCCHEFAAWTSFPVLF